ncbi:MAG: class I SAM-dependent methyltransferase [Deltaproteobacteria bacterium]|nr:class I SAM-dependent methyltransferase [Deltaproteobacteria bacterium]
MAEKEGPTSIWDNVKEQHWRNNFKVYWETLPEVERYQLKSMTGREDLHYFEYLINYIEDNIGKKGLRGLFIGCQEWDSTPEMMLIERGLFNKIEVLDIAENLLKKQEQLAQQKGIAGIQYIKRDCNHLQLEEDAYDLIFSVGTVHHIERLDSLFMQINRALKGNGIFAMREYVGPNRLQFTEEQLSVVNEILSILPEKYRITFDGLIKNDHTNISEEETMRIDPSESICSEDIISSMEKHLDVITINYTGGTILHPLMNGIASNFEEGEDASTILKLLIFFEKTLIEKKVLPSDYVFCMARKKSWKRKFKEVFKK